MVDLTAVIQEGIGAAERGRRINVGKLISIPTAQRGLSKAAKVWERGWEGVRDMDSEHWGRLSK